jgi:hypothetical protein
VLPPAGTVAVLMAGYLDQYGAGDARRTRVIRNIVIISVVALALAGVLLYVFHTYRQEKQVARFFDLLGRHDYQAAYALWVRTDADRQGYPYDAFMKDWGPDAFPVGKVEVLDGESCGSGVIVDVDTGKTGDKKLWVERDSLVISFPPPDMDRCPHRNRIADWLRGMKYRLHGRTYQ